MAGAATISKASGHSSHAGYVNLLTDQTKQNEIIRYISIAGQEEKQEPK